MVLHRQSRIVDCRNSIDLSNLLDPFTSSSVYAYSCTATTNTANFNLHAGPSDEECLVPHFPLQLKQLSPAPLIACSAEIMNLDPTQTTNEPLKPIKASKWEDKAVSLGTNFSPSKYDVICARGRNAWNHPGNKYFRDLVEERVEKYSKCENRIQRSSLVTQVLEKVRKRGNGFVKCDPKSGTWFEVGDLLAREKCGQMLRNALSGKYKSSVEAKRVRKKSNAAQKIHNDLTNLVLSNHSIKYAMDLASEISSFQPDEEVIEMFNQTNSFVLQRIKEDQTLLPRYQSIVDRLDQSKKRR